jgi:hypothetical protein
MAQYTVTMTVEDRLPASVEKKLRDAFGKDAPIHTVEKINRNPSRADRLSQAENMVEDAKSIVEELKDEIDQWKDSLPENLQSGSKADDLDSCSSALEEIGSQLESADFGNVEFPSMMG